ncbi:copper-translocating P-type ATPase [Thiococcus pfennigii]|uniref:copper-translocating P-type ATPase n=1 Tax=Thiococcus pfennigii TaxID=1057 RepID=UPI001F5B39F9|nr:copper-translocating P-type ATPase [Thiococcus pfennigii]MBK1702191.1 copper-translocating P-type ATPase [Thiococcus pfennigii]
MVADFRRRFLVSLALTLPILALSPLIQRTLGLEAALAFPGDAYVLLGLSTVVFLYGGWPFLRGLAAELGRRDPGMMTLISLAIAVAYFYSVAVVLGLAGQVFFWELATLIDVMLLGHWIEMRSVMGASGALEALVKLMPTTAHRLGAGGAFEDVPVAELRPSDQVLVKPGEKVPTDGVIRRGRSALDESMLTGESKPVEKGEGDEAIGGAVNGAGAITVEIRKTGDETYLSEVIDMVRQAQSTRSRTQDLANRAARWLTYIALSVGALTLPAWLALGQAFDFALSRMVTVMVITCPHALGLAVPLVVTVSTSMAAGRGLLIRDRAAFERARNLQAIVFDKTGTLTEGRFGVSDLVALGDRPQDEVLRLAAALESQSSHPIAAGVVEAARARDIVPAEVSDFENLPGQGARAAVEGRDVAVVSPGYLGEHGIAVEDDRPRALMAAGKTVVFVLVQDELVGAIALADVVREESRDAIARLKDKGIRCIMLTGDAEAVAKRVAGELGLDDFFAEVLPHQKAERIREVKARGLVTAMVGDGVNDAPALVEADLGVAIGAGTDVAIESADIVLVKSDPRAVLDIMALSRSTYGKMIQNLLWATGYNAFAIPLAAGVASGAGVVLTPAVGAALMSLSTVIVAINARLLKWAQPTR